MKPPNRRFSVHKLRAAVAASIALLVVLFAAASPETTAGYWLFRCVYASPIPRSALLETYQSLVWEVEGGHTPDHTDRFLCSRLEAAPSNTETGAIAHFYVLQAYGRLGTRIVSLSEEAKQKVIVELLQKIDDYDAREVHLALVLVEGLRRGENLGKARFRHTDSEHLRAAWWEETGVQEVKELYRKWWQTPEPWSVKQRKNPLAGTNLEATAL